MEERKAMKKKRKVKEISVLVIGIFTLTVFLFGCGNPKDKPDESGALPEPSVASDSESPA